MTTISVTATVRVRGLDSQEHAATVAQVLGRALSTSLNAATVESARPRDVVDAD